jgi:hypothetical protein
MTSGKHRESQGCFSITAGSVLAGMVLLHTSWTFWGCRDKLSAQLSVLLLHTVLLANKENFNSYLLHPVINHFHPVNCEFVEVH